MDRIDIVVDVDRPDPSSLLGAHSGPDSASLREQVSRARMLSLDRSDAPTAALSGATLLSAADLDETGRRTLEHAARMHHLSGRGITRLLRVARTIADLDGSARVKRDHLTEALGYRVRGAL